MEKTKRKSRISRLLSEENFAEIERIFHRHFKSGLETTNSRAITVESLCSKDCQPEFCRIVQSSTIGLRRCNKDRRRCIEIATETGQSYISICHAGIVLVCVPVMDKDKELGGMFFGKCL